jgi:hypothetical protein
MQIRLFVFLDEEGSDLERGIVTEGLLIADSQEMELYKLCPRSRAARPSRRNS